MSPGNVRQCAPKTRVPRVLRAAQDLGHFKIRPGPGRVNHGYDCYSVIVARRYLISGRVQGVGFRYFTEATARREGIIGWVRNTPDGRVEVAAEGDAEALERFERSLRHGPRGARVERVDVDDTIPAGREAGFTIK